MPTISFNEHLLKALNEVVDTTEKKCLISNEKLDETQITLYCNHSFNYLPLLNEITIQKKKVNYLETQRLGNKQIKCPYCRTTQNGILPFIDGYEKIIFVNWPEKYAYKPNKCKYTFLSGKKKNKKCERKICDNYCKQHLNIIENRDQKKK